MSRIQIFLFRIFVDTDEQLVSFKSPHILKLETMIKFLEKAKIKQKTLKKQGKNLLLMNRKATLQGPFNSHTKIIRLSSL